MTEKKLICLRCDFGKKHEDPWLSRISNGGLPIACPRCKSTLWNKPYRKKVAA